MTGRAATDTELIAWRAALDLWNVQLHPPNMVRDSSTGTFAWFSFPPSISIDVDELTRHGAQHHLVSVFAHEIGHHVLSPSTRVVSFKLLQQMARAIAASDPRHAVPVTSTARKMSNLWSDLLINDRVVRMQRRRHPGTEPDMIALWRTLTAREPVTNAAWWVLMRAYELLWSLPSGTLCPDDPPVVPDSAREEARARQDIDPAALDVSMVRKNLQDKERAHRAAALRVRALQDELLLSQPVQPVADAEYLAQAVRTFGADPVGGALTFGMVLMPYLVLESMLSDSAGLPGGGCAEQDGTPATAAELAEVLSDPRLDETPVHPAASAIGVPSEELSPEPPPGQRYGVAQTLDLFAGSDPNAVMLAWYEAQARPWIRSLRQPGHGVAEEGIPGPLETWELGDDIAELDWPATLAANAVVVPGVTTRRRTYLPDDPVATTEAVTLDLYIDSSGSMPRPERGSPAVLAGMILVLSVLKGGGRARVTSWSGRGQVAGDGVFTRDRLEIMRQLTTYFGGSTVFPLDLLADRYLPGDGARDELRHLVVLSDDGLMSLFGAGQQEYATVAAEVRRKLDTATLLVQDRSRSVAGPAAEAGYAVDYLDNMSDAPAVCARLAAHIAGYRREVLRG